MTSVAAFVLTFAFAVPVLAQVQFSADEIRRHQDNIDTITDTASRCLRETYADHVQFYRKWGVSKYYGDRKPEYKTEAGRRLALRQYGAPDSLITELTPTSCVGLTMTCLEKGFAAAGQQSTWNKIYAQLKVENKFYGTDLQVMLRGLGWKIVYWNPDPRQNAAWDAEDQALNPLKPGKTWNPVWGGHAYNYAQVTRKSIYSGYSIPVDDAQTLVGYGTKLPESFKQIPFFVGTAHSGYHVFPGFFGTVIEAHSMRELNSFDNLETAPFNPLAPGGGPRWTRIEKYRSGIVAVPPKRR